MIRVKTEDRKDDLYPTTNFICPYCGKQGTFYSVSPERCLDCHQLLPDMKRLSVDLLYRMDYYKGAV